MRAQIQYSSPVNRKTLSFTTLLASGMLFCFSAAGLFAAPEAESPLGSELPGRISMLCKGFLPPNDLYIPEGTRDASGISQEQFNAVLDSLERLYAPVVAKQGGVLEIRRLWSDGTVNASTGRQGNKYILNMYGGLARHSATTMDGFALVACHEMGHQLGGAPKKPGTWATNEGQADYYANLKCLRRMFTFEKSSEFTRSTLGDEVAEKGCAQQFPDPAGRALCVRSAIAGKSLSALLMAMRKETVEPRFDTPDPAVVGSMQDSHPATQCRLDTYLQGSLCNQPVESGLSDTNPVTGTCTRSGGFTSGFRPLCWYRPSSASELLPPGSALEAVGSDRALASPDSAFSVLQGGTPWQ